MKAPSRILLLSVAVLSMAAPADALCPDAPVSRAFEQWGDDAHYAAVPGGDFNSSLDWTVTGSATLVSEVHPFALDPDDTTSVQVARDATITSPPVCVTRDHPHVRFVARSIDKKSHLHVEALYRDERGRAVRKSLGDNDGKKFWNWGLVKEVSLKAVLPRVGVVRMVQLRFISRGGRDGWLIDSVFVDPVKRA